MNQSDYTQFCAMLNAVADLYGKPVNSTQSAMYFRILSNFPLEQIQWAFDAHAKCKDRGRFMPLPADLLSQLERAIANDGRPSPEEAWSTATKAMDEAVTVVWTSETAQAWAAVGCELMAAGDKFNASRGFIAKYQELVAEARKAGIPAKWEVSQGHDKDLRHSALETAYKAKLITRDTVVQMLPRHNQDVGPIVAAIAGNMAKMIASDKPIPAVTDAQQASQRLRDLIAAVNTKAAEPAPAPKPTTENNMRIVNEAIERGIIRGLREIDGWMTKARNREDLSQLQALMLGVKNG